MTAQHAGPVDEPAAAQAEPVAVAEAVRLAPVAIVAAGWLVIPVPTINVITSGVALVVSVVSTVLARRRVTPLAAPRAGDGSLLAPIPSA